MKIGVFYLNAGGGHRSAALALQENLRLRHPEAEVKVAETLSFWPIANWIVKRGYASMVNDWPFFWSLMMFINNHFLIGPRVLNYLFGRAFLEPLLREFQKNKFDKIVLTHFALAKAAVIVKKKLNLKSELILTVTDPFSPHVFWFLNKNLELAVFSRPAQDLARKYLPANQKVVCFSPLIRPDLDCSPAAKQKAREILGAGNGDKLVLVAAGGDGLKDGYKITKALLGLGDDLKIAVVCGRDKKFFESVTILKNKYSNLTAVFAFADLAQIMPGADVVVGKAGPATVLEAITLKKPLVLSSYIYRHEYGNVELVAKNGLGIYEPNPKKLAQQVKKIIFDEKLKIKLTQNLSQFNIKNGLNDLADYIVREVVN